MRFSFLLPLVAALFALVSPANAAPLVGDDFDRVTRLVRLGGFVNSVPDFDQQPKIVNGCSDLMVNVFGDKGRHARTAVGTNVLPFNVAVEVEAIFEIRS